MTVVTRGDVSVLGEIAAAHAPDDGLTLRIDQGWK